MSFKFAQTFIFTFAAISLASYPTPSKAFYHHPTGPFATRFWDCCRPSFSWPHPAAKLYAPVDTCQKDGVTLVTGSALSTGKSGCEGGDQFTCSCMQPWQDSVDPELGYAFGAYNIHDPDGTIEGACYLNEFKAQDSVGKTMKVNKLIVQNINTSQGITKGSWDLNLAGGGVGEYNKGCAAQWGHDWGQTYGGVDNEQACCSLPEGLRSSCLFRFVLFGDNPELASTPVRVRCPQGLIDRSGAQRQDDAQVAPYSGKTDKTGQPAPDKYKRNRSVCQNVDPLGVVSSVCGGSGGARLPKGSGMMRQDAPGGAVPGDEGTGSSAQPGGQMEGYGQDGGEAASSGGQMPAGPVGQPGRSGQPGQSGPAVDQGAVGQEPGSQPGQPEGYSPGLPVSPGSDNAAEPPMTHEQNGGPQGYGKPPKQGSGGVPPGSSPANPHRALAGHRRGVCNHKGGM